MSLKEHSSKKRGVNESSYLQKFGVHLASRLVGSDNILQRFESVVADNSNSFRVYWRTPLPVETDPLLMSPFESISSKIDPITSDPSLEPASSSSSSSSSWKMVFMDVTFDFRIVAAPAISSQVEISAEDDSATHQNMQAYVDVTMGALLRHKDEETGVYVQGSPLQMTKLRRHVDQMDIDLDSTENPEPLANNMANALLSFPTGIKAKTTRAQPHITIVAKVPAGESDKDDTRKCNAFDSIEILVPLFYSEIDETAHLRIDSFNLSQIDANAMTMLFCNLYAERVDDVSSKGSDDDKEKDTSTHENSENSLAVALALQKWCSEATTSKSHIIDSISSKKDPVIESAQPASGFVGVSQAVDPSVQSAGSSSVQPPRVSTTGIHSPDTDRDSRCSEQCSPLKRKGSIQLSSDDNGKDKDSKKRSLISEEAVGKRKRCCASEGYVLVDRAATSKRRKRGKVIYSKMKGG